MLPGGAFLTLIAEDTLQMSTGTNLASGFVLAKRLATSPYNYKVILVKYQTTNNLQHSRTIFPIEHPSISAQCSYVSNETGKARALSASYTSFQSLRKILQEYKIGSPANEVDTNNIFLVGISAGAVLALNTLFLQKSEIPSTITYKSNCNNPPGSANISIPFSVRNDYWDLPKIKGVVAMSGAWIYDNYNHLTDSTPPSSFNSSIYLMHGTCDEIIHRKDGRIGYKYVTESTNLNMVKYINQNLDTISRYIYGRGSETIFNTLKTIHSKVTYGQIYRGGHENVRSGNSVPNNLGSWDYKLASDSINTPIFQEVAGFISRLVADGNDWETRAFVLDTLKIPELPTQKCLGADSTAYNSLLCYATIKQPAVNPPAVICTASDKIITIQNIQQGVSYQWSVSATANLTIVSGASSPILTIKRKNDINKTDTLFLKLKRPCADSIVKQYIIQTQTGTLNPVIGPSGWNTICSGNNTATLSGVPAGVFPTWSVSGNLDLVSSSGNSITYKRKNNILSTGTIRAIFNTSCGVDTFNFTVNTFPTLGNWINTFGIVSECDFGIVTISPSKVPNGTQATFSTIFSNAATFGVTDLIWETDCIPPSGGGTQTWIGNDLREDYTITATTGCTYVRVRPQNSCGTGSWKTTGISVEPCGGGGWSMMVAPNPANSYLEVSLTNEDEKKLQQTFNLQVIDAMGNTIIKTSITEGKQQLNISDLKEGVYKAIIQTEDELLYRTFHVGR
jgi:hypothetical protein